MFPNENTMYTGGYELEFYNAMGDGLNDDMILLQIQQFWPRSLEGYTGLTGSSFLACKVTIFIRNKDVGKKSNQAII